MEDTLKLSTSLNESINDEMTSVISEIAEIGLDSILEDGLLKEVPFISTAISLYKIGSSISEKHNIKKLALFINEINNKTADENKRKKYREKIASDKNINKELEYILVLIDRYLDYKKPQMLAILFLAFLDNKVTWNTFAEFSEIIDRLLLSDIDALREFYYRGDVIMGSIIEQNNDLLSSIQRLVSVGFVEQRFDISVINHNSPRSRTYTTLNYWVTNSGKTFINLLIDHIIPKNSSTTSTLADPFKSFNI